MEFIIMSSQHRLDQTAPGQPWCWYPHDTTRCDISPITPDMVGKHQLINQPVYSTCCICRIGWIYVECAEHAGCDEIWRLTGTPKGIPKEYQRNINEFHRNSVRSQDASGGNVHCTALYSKGSSKTGNPSKWAQPVSIWIPSPSWWVETECPALWECQFLWNSPDSGRCLVDWASQAFM